MIVYGVYLPIYVTIMYVYQAYWFPHIDKQKRALDAL